MGVRMHLFGHGLAEFAYSGVMGGHSSRRVVILCSVQYHTHTGLLGYVVISAG